MVRTGQVEKRNKMGCVSPFYYAAQGFDNFQIFKLVIKINN